ncbi:MAG: hypothetical protein GY924_05665 [Planctomycetaceae bacterium]|nr:hypothetical protein [Planctomycetaceae bacterium]
MQNRSSSLIRSLRIPIVCLVLFFGCLLFWRFVQDAGSAGNLSAPTLAVETTVLTDPKYVREDGSISYVRAFNDHGLANIDMQENACVDFMRAMGPRDSPAEWALAWQALVHGGVPLPNGPFFTKLDPGSVNRKSLDESGTRPWTAGEFPAIQQWLVANQEPLAQITAGAKKDRFFYPLTTPDRWESTLSENLIGLYGPLLEVVRCLKSRSMNHLGNNQPQACLRDLITIRRIAHLVSQTGTVAALMTGSAIHGTTIVPEFKVIETGKLTVLEIDQYLQQVEELPLFETYTRTLDVSVRYMALDELQAFAFGKPCDPKLYSNTGEVSNLFQNIPTTFDLDEARQALNVVHDDYVDASMAMTFAKKNELISDVDEDLIATLESANQITKRMVRSLAGIHSRGDFMGHVTAAMLNGDRVLLGLETRRIAIDRMSYVAFRCEQYRLKQGHFPESLKDLQIDDETQLIDPYSGKMLIYVSRMNGFSIYAVGENMLDEQGSGLITWARTGNSDGDDIGFQLETVPASVD